MRVMDEQGKSLPKRRKVAEHKDVEDDGQTVTITEVPEMPGEPTPEQPTTPDTPTKTSDAPKTGDNTNIALFLGLLVLSGAGVAGTYFFKRRKRSWVNLLMIKKTNFKEMRYEYMKLKYILSNMVQTFGNLEFAGENDVE